MNYVDSLRNYSCGGGVAQYWGDPLPAADSLQSILQARPQPRLGCLSSPICTSSGSTSCPVAIANIWGRWASRDKPRAACSGVLTRTYPMTAAVLLSSIFALGLSRYRGVGLQKRGPGQPHIAAIFLYCCTAIFLYCCKSVMQYGFFYRIHCNAVMKYFITESWPPQFQATNNGDFLTN